MKATIRCVALPDGSGLALDMVLHTTLPFIPHPGMWLNFHNDGEYLAVARVYWDKCKPNEIDVHLVEPDNEAHMPFASQLVAQGWLQE